MPASSPPPRRPDRPAVPSNQLLHALSAPDYAMVVPQLTRVALGAGELLSKSHSRPRHVYFPETAVLSLIIDMEDGDAVEAATVGNEGMAGLSATLGDGAMNSRCLAQIAGDAQRIPVAVLVQAIADRPGLDVVLRRYTQAFINQLAQSVACNRLHTIDQRCARWLLMTHDRVGGGDTFDLTQEFLSYMLGVRREGVSAASGALQRRGVIRYRRGRIAILDRAALEKAACECYAETRREYTQLYRSR
ncbi:MAG TPA: Crp/Fnr family transcriptional regulator [Gemmatimonadaceae bacterium]|nr:Crp/Fnr family transcriptional regulator [Gemmatimonadaceae bacterium]